MLDEYENAFLISNQTAYTILYTNYSINTVRILNESGIATIICNNKEELKILLSCNYTYDFINDLIYIHDYSYYELNEIRTDQYWLSVSDINEYLPNGWKCTYVGKLGIITRKDYSYSNRIQNTATDDDIIFSYIYSEEIDFTKYLLEKIKERVTSALPFDRLSNRVFRPILYSNFNDCVNIGARNESMFDLLPYPRIKNFPANCITIKSILNFSQSRFAERHISQFDLGQYKNMCNVLAAIYVYYDLYHQFPKIYMVGSAPSYWLRDVLNYHQFDVETWDPLPTPFSIKHHQTLFLDNDIKLLKDNSVLYIDIRTDRDGMEWKKWRNIVEEQTINNLNLALKFIRGGKNRVVCVKMTSMDIVIPLDSILLHFPTSYVRSEFYIILHSKMNLNVTKFVPAGTFYSFINSILSDNVFIGSAYKLKNTSRKVVALYALQNAMNTKCDVIRWLNSLVNDSLITLRLNNTFDYANKSTFKDSIDYLYIPTDLGIISAKTRIVTSYKGASAMYSLSTSNDIKANGNNHIFILVNNKNYSDMDKYANHMSISRRSHSIRFSEAATALSGYMFRNLSNNVTNMHYVNEDNYASGHLYNALIYFRYNYTFDIIRWIKLHNTNRVNVIGGKYYRHSFIELSTAVEAARKFGELQNDLTLIEYANKIYDILIKLYKPRYADNPNAYLGVTFTNFNLNPSGHLSMGMMLLMDNDLEKLNKMKDELRSIFNGFDPVTKYTYRLGKYVVAAVSNVQNTYNKLYNLFSDNNITFGQSRVFIPHITISDSLTMKLFEYEPINLNVKDIYIKSLVDKSILMRLS